MATHDSPVDPLEVFWRAVEKVRDRLLRACRALDGGGVDYAVIGGNAVAWWVETIAPSASRATPNVNFLIRRGDLAAARACLEAAGFEHVQSAGIDMFLDGPKARDAVHAIFAGEKVRPDYALPAPDPSMAVVTPSGWRVIALPELVRMKLTSFRLKDQVHLQDMLSVGLIDDALVASLPDALRERLQPLIDNPDA